MSKIGTTDNIGTIVPYTTEVKNCYPNLPEYLYVKNTLALADVVAYIKSLPYADVVLKSVLTVDLNESGNEKNVILNNSAGIQADNSPWNHRWYSIIVGTVVLVDSTGAKRRFVVFDKWQSCLDMLAWYFNSRGIFIGGNASEYAKINPVRSAVMNDGLLLQVDLYTAYLRGWVLGDVDAIPKLSDIKGHTSLYNRASTLIDGAVVPMQESAPVVYRKIEGAMIANNDTVRLIQTKLANLGLFKPENITGNYWTLTELSVKAFQSSKGLQATGICDADTLKALGI